VSACRAAEVLALCAHSPVIPLILVCVRARVAQGCDKPEKALADYDEVLRLNPNDPMAKQGHARVFTSVQKIRCVHAAVAMPARASVLCGCLRCAIVAQSPCVCLCWTCGELRVLLACFLLCSDGILCACSEVRALECKEKGAAAYQVRTNRPTQTH
jgi:hypothetical protein